MIHFQEVSFGYRRKQQLFDKLDLRLELGSIYGLLGKNGAGKSSLLRLIHGLLYPTSGTVSVMGLEPRKRQPSLLSEIYMISEEAFLPNVNIKSLVKIYAPFYPKFSKTLFSEVLREFELEEKQYLKQLSWGQKKKVFLSFGLATNCKILLLDEPTNGLDIPSKTQFRQLIAKQINDERTFIISSHQIRDLHSLLESIIVLEKGKIIFHQRLEAIMESLCFQVVHEVPSSPEVFYAERIPGGYITVSPNLGNQDSLEADIEVLFNGIISQPDVFAHHFQKSITYAK